MSALTCTRVKVTNPIPGSWTSRDRSVASSARIWSATRLGREPCDMMAIRNYELGHHPLVVQRLGPGHLEFDREESHHHRQGISHESTKFISRFRVFVVSWLITGVTP